MARSLIFILVQKKGLVVTAMFSPNTHNFLWVLMNEDVYGVNIISPVAAYHSSW